MSWFLRRQDQTRWDSSLTTTTEACDLVIWSWYQLIPCTIDVMWVMWSFLIQSNWFDICLNGPVVFAFYPRINTTPYHESPSLLTAISEGRQKAGNYSPAAGFPREEDRHQSSTKKPLLRIISSSQRLDIWFIQEDVDTVKGAGFAEEKTWFFFNCIAESQDKGRRNARGLGFHFQRNHPGLLSWAVWEQEKETGSMPWHAICNWRPA